MDNLLIWAYVGLISFISAILFAYDKNAAISNRRRISERTLHLVELLGGVFITILLMYTLHHKNRKFSYWSLTWLILFGWATVLTFLFFKI